MTDNVWEIEFSYTKPPLSANQRMHWAQKAQITRNVRQSTANLARLYEVHPMARIEIRLDWYVKDRRRRDPDNMFPTFKAMADGLVDAGIIPDDTPQYMNRLMPRIVNDPYTAPRMVLIVKEIS